MALKRWDEVIFEDFPHPKEITKRMIAAARGHMRLYPGGARLCTGRISTTEDLEFRRERSRRPLYEKERPPFQPHVEPTLRARIYDYIAGIFS